MILGEAVMQTKSGTELWNAMANDERSVTLSISNEVRYSERGGLVLGVFGPNKSRGDNFFEITVYAGAIDKFVNPNKTYVDREKQELMRNSTAKERLGAVTVHEGLHFIDNVKDGKREERASAAQKKYLNEATNQKIIFDPDDAYDLFDM